MNQCIRDNWNSVVKPEDVVYNLGDVYFGKNWTGGETIIEFLNSLNGRKKLVLGNHDHGLDQILHRTFDKIEAWYKLPKMGLLLTHMPVHECQLGDTLKKNLHGHIHNNIINDRRYKNLCVEHWNYTPQLLDKFVET